MVMHKYTEEEREFFIKYTPGHSFKEITDAFNERFSEPITLSQVKGYLARHKLKTGTASRFTNGHIPFNKGRKGVCAAGCEKSWFKNGHLPHNTKPIGYERITKEGYIEVKVKMRPSQPGRGDNFITKQRLIWEEHYGPVPAGYCVVFLDGNNRNFDIENLHLVSRAENARINRQRMRSNSAELTKSAIMIARLSVATNKKRKREE